MVAATDAKLCYGIAFPEGFAFPWKDADDPDDAGDWEAWWLEQHGYVQTPAVDWSNYDQDRLKPEWQATKDAMLVHQKAFTEAHPCPFEVVSHCSDECQMYILAVPETETIASRGETVIIDPASLVAPAEAVARFEAFVREYIAPTYDAQELDEEVDGALHWYLCSYWG